MQPYCFILSWERPIYLWSTLYSLLRNTKKNLNYVLLDNASSDPMVAHVIRSFERRGMFADVHRYSDNDPRRPQKVFEEYRSKLGAFYYFVENDVLVPEATCWASVYEDVFHAHPKVGMVGSLSEIDDIVSEDDIRREHPGLDERKVRFYSRRDYLPSLLTTLDPKRDATSGDFPNPPGRLLLLGTEAVDRVGIKTDSLTAHEMEQAGFHWFITTKFRHRHLSLMSYYDYLDGSEVMPRNYVDERHEYFDRAAGRSPWRRAASRLLRPFRPAKR